jgi:ergothioneine biosynthesis protein EgtB
MGNPARGTPMATQAGRRPAALASGCATRADARPRRAAERRRRDDPADPDASPAKWHLAHTTWFFETFVLRDHVPGYRRSTSASPICSTAITRARASATRGPRGMLSRPSLDEVRAWRAHVDEALGARAAAPAAGALELVELGINHEQQHQELFLTDILATFAENPLEPRLWRASEPAPASRRAAELPIGNPAPGEGPGRDRRMTGRLRLRLRAAAPPGPAPPARPRRPPGVTNGEWLRVHRRRRLFDPTLWLSDGWDWVQREGIEAPLYWRETAAAGSRLAGRREIDPAAPVAHISYYEADAFARWAGARLPTEAEWESAAAVGRSRPRQPARRGRPGPPAPRRRACSATSGNGPKRLLPTPASPGRARSANITASSCAGSSCSRARAAPPRAAIPRLLPQFLPAPARWQFTGLRLARDADDQADPAFRADVLAGLAAPIPAIPARWLYDRRGSELFDEITRLPEYYPTRTETALARAIMPEIAAARPAGRGGGRIRLGLSTKTPILLARVAPAAYVRSTSAAIICAKAPPAASAEFPGLRSIPVEADFTRPFELPARSRLPKLGFFPGSTIGNFVPRSATDLLRHFRETARATGAQAADRHGPGQAGRAADRAYDDPPASPPSSTSTCSTGSTASSTATSRSTPSATRRAGTT